MEIVELASFAEDVAALDFPCMAGVAREPGPIEEIGEGGSPPP